MAETPPASKQKLLNYLALECPGGDLLSEEDLVFVGRSEDSEEMVWAWRFTDAYGTTCYVTVEPYAESYLIGYSDRLPPGI